MAQIIQVAEAAKRLGVSRQTLMNWSSDGIIDVRNIAGSNKSLWVDWEALEKLAPIMTDIEKARLALEKQREEMKEEYKRNSACLTEVRNNITGIERLGRLSTKMDFYESIPHIMYELGLINGREMNVVLSIIYGNTLEAIAEQHGLTRQRILQIYAKALRKSKEIGKFKDDVLSLETTREELERAKSTILYLNRELASYKRLEDMENKTMDEKVTALAETDNMIKLLTTRLVDCELSVRALNCLKCIDVDTIGDLVQLNKTDLLKLRNFGRKTMYELDDFLESLNLCWGTDVKAIFVRKMELQNAVQQNKEGSNVMKSIKEKAKEFGDYEDVFVRGANYVCDAILDMYDSASEVDEKFGKGGYDLYLELLGTIRALED